MHLVTKKEYVDAVMQKQSKNKSVALIAHKTVLSCQTIIQKMALIHHKHTHIDKIQRKFNYILIEF